MKCLIFSIIFTSLIIILSSASDSIIQTTNQNENLVNFACNITRDAINSRAHTQDILIGNLRGKDHSFIINDLIRCIGEENSVVVTDLKLPMVEKNLRKASAVVLIVDELDVSTVASIIINHQFSKVWHHMTKILCISTTNMSDDRQMKILHAFSYYGFMNVAIASAISDGIEVMNLQTIQGDAVVYENIQDSQRVFPDRLKNLTGYQYRVIVYNQPPRLIIDNYTITSNTVHFISEVAIIQNANVRLFFIDDYRKFADIWFNRQMDLTLNTGVSFPDAQYPKLLTYEESGYCALVPRPQKVPISALIFIKPFDGFTWAFFMLTIACCGLVWWLFRRRGAVDSHWLLFYGIFVFFIGQGVNFSYKNRLILTILLQIIIFMVFVLSNAYEGVITSFMIQPIQEHRLETFDQILSSDYKIMTDDVFANAIKDSEEFIAMRSRINTSAVNIGERYSYEIRRQHYVFVKECENAEYDINFVTLRGQKLSDFYYLLPERILNHYVRLEASFLNPLIERLQYYMDLSFEAGLPQAWGIYSYYSTSSQHESENPTYLELKDLIQVFYILLIGYVAGIVVLLIEIFFHDFLKNLHFAYLGRQLRNRVNKMAYKKKPKDPKYQNGALYYIIHRHQKVKRLQPKRLKVREIFVRPINPEN